MIMVQMCNGSVICVCVTERESQTDRWRGGYSYLASYLGSRWPAQVVSRIDSPTLASTCVAFYLVDSARPTTYHLCIQYHTCCMLAISCSLQVIAA